jgi:cytochrome c peroxidase
MRLLVWIAGLFVFFSCSSPGKKLDDGPLHLKVPSYFPVMPVPPDNELTVLRVELGKKLFYDPRLSGDGSTSCGSCHILSSAFTDGKPTSSGFGGKFGKRNAPTLANLAWAPRLMGEGGVASLELQVLAPSVDSTEMNFNLAKCVEVLKKDNVLNELSVAAYNRELDPFVVIRAIAAFERTMVSGDSRYDRYQYLGQKDELNEQELNGMELFYSEKTNCASCHSGVFFTDNGYYNIGLYEEYQDKGRRKVTYDDGDIGKFKVPTLRNVELTAPYMHDGSINTLDEVVEFLNLGGHAHPNKDSRIRELHLSVEEKESLVAFLKCLTDWNFVQNRQFLSGE